MPKINSVPRISVAIVGGLLLTVSALCFGSGGGSLRSPMPSPGDQAVDAYNTGVKEVSRAQSYESDAAKRSVTARLERPRNIIKPPPAHPRENFSGIVVAAR